MSFQINKILDSQPERILAKVSYQNNQIIVIIPNKELKDIVIGESFQAEIDYDNILNWKVISDFDDTKSNIWQEKDGVHLLGRIHNIVELGDGKVLIYVYVQNGPEFFTVSSETIDNKIPENSAGLEITVNSLHLHPNKQKSNPTSRNHS